MTATHVFVGSTKIYWLKQTSRSARGLLKFNVLSSKEIRKTKFKAATTLQKWEDDPNLYTASAFEKIDTEAGFVKIGGFKLLRRKSESGEAQIHVPAKKEYHFPDAFISELMQDILQDQNVYLVGGPGVGKTTVIQQLASRLNIPCLRVQTSSGITPEGLVGGYVPSETGSARWADGLVTKAARNGWWVILDEWDFAPSHIKTVLNGLLESGNRQLSLVDKDGGEVLSRASGTIHKDFRVFATGNTAGCMADSAEFFGGFSDPNSAQLQRFNVYKVEQLKGDALVKVLKKQVPQLKTKHAVIISQITTQLEAAKIPGVWFSTRVALAMAMKLKNGKSSVKKVLIPCFLNHFSESDRNRILEAITIQGE